MNKIQCTYPHGTIVIYLLFIHMNIRNKKVLKVHNFNESIFLIKMLCFQAVLFSVAQTLIIEGVPNKCTRGVHGFGSERVGLGWSLNS